MVDPGYDFDPRVCEVVEWGKTDWGEIYPSAMLIGCFANRDDKTYYKFPKTPKKRTDVLFHDLPKKDQYWRRFPEHPEWSWDYINQRAVDDFKIGDTIDGRWFEDAENLTPSQIRYMDEHWNYRNNGFWMYVNGLLFYVPGKYYMFLQWAPMTGGAYPDFREKQWLHHLAWQSMIENPFCLGECYIKGRREGYTNECVSDLVDETTKSYKATSTIQSSLDEEHALEEIWMPIFLPMIANYPPFFKPQTKTADLPIGGKIIFDEPAKRGKSVFKNRRPGLGSVIKVETSTGGQSKSDGGKRARLFFDEPGKEKKRDLRKQLGTIRPAMTQGGLVGKIRFGSTVEESESGFSLQIATIVKMSMPSQVKDDGFTESGLHMLFFPADYCLDEDYIDKYGRSITYTPTPEQVEDQRKRQWPRILATVNGDEEKAMTNWLKIKSQKYDKGGSYNWVLNFRNSAGTDAERSDRKRRFPLTLDDALLPSAKTQSFDQEKLQEALTRLEAPGPDGKPLWESMTLHGNFEWAETYVPTEGMFKGTVQPVRLGPVKWVAYHKGHERARAIIQRNAVLGENNNWCPYKPNQVHRQIMNGVLVSIRPYTPVLDFDLFKSNPNSNKFAIGVDPYNFNTGSTAQNKGELSNGSAWCKWMEDPDEELVGDTAEERIAAQRSNSYLWRYNFRPARVEEFAEDILKAAIFFGAPVNVERDQSALFQDFFEREHAKAFLMHDQLSLDNDSVKQAADPPRGTRANHTIGFGKIAEFIASSITIPHKYPSPQGVRQLMSVTENNISSHDDVASMEMTEMVKPRHQQNGGVAFGQGNTQLAPQKQARKSTGTLRTYSVR